MRDKSIISGNIWSSRLEFWKVAILKDFGKLPKSRLWKSSPNNVVDTPPEILKQKRPSRKVAPREVHLKLCQASMMESFGKHFQFILDIWQSSKRLWNGWCVLLQMSSVKFDWIFECHGIEIYGIVDSIFCKSGREAPHHHLPH